MNYERSERIRRAAILVASVEETVGEQMLAALPRAEAARIRAEVELLDEVDLDEQQDVLDEFRRAGRQASAAEPAVEFTYSASQVATAPLMNDELASSRNENQTANNQDDAAEATLMAELLVEEHPQIVAAALSKLNHEQAAAVFAALPPSLQAEVVDRLANLQPADEDAVQELQTQLEQRVQRHRERRERAAAGAELARKILAKTPAAQQVALLARLSPQNASHNNNNAQWSASSVQAQELANAIERARGIEPLPSEGVESTSRFEAWTDSRQPTAELESSPNADVKVEDCSRELEQLTDHELLDALRVADEQTVQRALAVSSESFLNRVAGKLPRRQAARLRKAVRAVGPATLAELRAAQNDLLRIAQQRTKELAA
jgi:flagellar motor switch protein FliG